MLPWHQRLQMGAMRLAATSRTVAIAHLLQEHRAEPRSLRDVILSQPLFRHISHVEELRTGSLERTHCDCHVKMAKAPSAMQPTRDAAPWAVHAASSAGTAPAAMTAA